MKTMITTILVILTHAAAAHSQEMLEYDLTVLGSEFGSATLYTSGPAVYGEIKANQKWKSIYNINNKIASKINKSGDPFRTEYDFKFTKTSGKYDIKFIKNKISSVRTSKGKKVKKVFTSNVPTQDPISWLFKVRNTLKLGKSQKTPMTFKVFSGSRFYNVVCDPLPPQMLYTKIGEKMSQPYKVTVTRSTHFRQEMIMWFNIESDSYEPLKVVGDFKLGTAEANISSYKIKSKSVHKRRLPTNK